MKAIGKQTITVVYGEIYTLTVPTGATFARITVEPDSTSANREIAIRYWINGSTPTPSQGHHLGSIRHGLRVSGALALSQIKFTGVEEDKSHVLQVTYYK